MSGLEGKTHFKIRQSFDSDYSTSKFTQYVSERTGMQVVVIDCQGPKVSGYFTLATEIHDDSGAPHTLEHLVFMGSKSYRYKGFLDKLATRAYSFTNAWTATDHTAYTLETAGWQGFAQILPIYLDHVLFPTLSDAACYTEVYHVDGSGHDAGVVYSEMQGVQNTQSELMDIQARRLMYPKNVGFRYETGGHMEQLRELTAERIRSFHGEMYQPRNLCLILTGPVNHTDLINILDEFENGILEDIPGKSLPWKRPWVDSPKTPALETSHLKTIEFPEEDESSGEILIGFLGPDTNDALQVAALGVVLVYLAGSSVSPLENVIVEKEQIASAVYYSTDTRPDMVIWFTLSSVATKDLSKVEARFFEVLDQVVSKPFNMQYMSECISRSKRQIKSQVEESGNLFAENVISDFLFGKDDGSTLHDLKTLAEYDDLEQWTENKWNSFIRQWISDAHHVSVLGVPSAAMSQRLKDEEESRVAARKEKLGQDGLKQLAEKLEAAKAENDKEIPRSLLEKFKTPGVESIKWINTITARSGLARNMGHLNNNIQSIVDKDRPDLPLFIHFEHIPSNFVHFTLLISTSTIPLTLRPLLPLYFDNFFNTPISRDGKTIPFEQIVMELEEATVSYEIGEGSRVGAPENIRASFHVEPERYSSAIEWLRQMLSESIFDETRLAASVAKLRADVPDEKRRGDNMMYAVSTMIHYAPESIARAESTLVKALYLKRIDRLLKEDPKSVISDMESVRKSILQFENLRVIVAANLEKLHNPVSSWKPFLENLDTTQTLKPVSNRRERLSEGGRSLGKLAYIVPLPTIDSSFSVHVSRGPRSANDPNVPALMVAIAYLDAVEGPMWVGVRGTGLAYGTGFSRNTESGLIQFRIYRSPNAYNAFVVARKIVSDFVSGDRDFDPLALEGAISSIVVSFADEESTMSSAAYASFMNQVIKELPKDFNAQVLEKVQRVTVEKVKDVLRTVIMPIFTPGTSNLVVTCAPAMEESIQKGFEKEGFNPSVKPLSFFQDDYGLSSPEDLVEGDSDEEFESGEEDESELAQEEL